MLLPLACLTKAVFAAANRADAVIGLFFCCGAFCSWAAALATNTESVTARAAIFERNE
jgi:hypothetical protein